MLSIMILTRNRKKEILRTLQSCVECSLPEKVEFVIVDNASEDGTKEVVDRFFKSNVFAYQYHYLSENVGVAAGRNMGFRNAKGRYVYFIDDDAYVDGPKQEFFSKMIDFLVENETVFCVTTSIYDTKLKSIRWVISSKESSLSKYKKVLVFHGGSFLVDKQRGFDRENLFLGHEFIGSEELYPALRNYFNQRYIVEMNDVNIIHDPNVNSSFDKKKRIILGYVHATHVKLIFYPFVAYPIVYLMFCLRILKHLGIWQLFGAWKQLSLRNREIKKETISFRVFWKFVREFGFLPTF